MVDTECMNVRCVLIPGQRTAFPALTTSPLTFHTCNDALISESVSSEN